MPDTPVRRARATLPELEDHGAFQRRHIGPDAAEQQAMLELLGYASRAELIAASGATTTSVRAAIAAAGGAGGSGRGVGGLDPGGRRGARQLRRMG